MKKVFYCFICLLMSFFVVTQATAQKKKKGKMPALTPEAIASFRQSYKQLMMDSLFMPAILADTTSATECEYQEKLFAINNDKKMDQEEKDMRTGMLDETKENRLKLILPGEYYDRLMSFQRRRKAEYEARQKEMKDAQNQQNNSIMNNNRGGYGRGGYGGYGGYGGRY